MAVSESRGQRLVERWNAGDRAYVVDQLADAFTLKARLPKLPVPAFDLTVRSKTAFHVGLWALQGRLPRYDIISVVENARTIFLVLNDPDRHQLAVTIKLDSDGRFTSIRSFRPDRPRRAASSRGMWLVDVKDASGAAQRLVFGTNAQMTNRVRGCLEEGYSVSRIIDPSGSPREPCEFDFRSDLAPMNREKLQWALLARPRRRRRRS